MASPQQPDAERKPSARIDARILYVDDEEALAHLARRMIARLGCKVAAYTDPNQALQAFRERPRDFDLVITDLSMPQMSGFDLVRELRVTRADVPIILTSGFIDRADEDRARGLGVHEILLKPATLESLAASLERMFKP